MSIEETFLLNQLLEGLNYKAIHLLDQGMQIFINKVWPQLPKSEAQQGLKWHRVIMSFAWRAEVLPKLTETVELQSRIFNDLTKTETLAYLESHQWKLDEQALIDYIDQLKSTSYRDSDV